MCPVLRASKPLTDNLPLLKGAVIHRKKSIYCSDCSLALISHSSTVKLISFPLKKQTFMKFFGWNLLA